MTQETDKNGSLRLTHEWVTFVCSADRRILIAQIESNDSGQRRTVELRWRNVKHKIGVLRLKQRDK